MEVELVAFLRNGGSNNAFAGFRCDLPKFRTSEILKDTKKKMKKKKIKEKKKEKERTKKKKRKKKDCSI